MKPLAFLLILSFTLFYAPSTEAKSSGGFKPKDNFDFRVTKVKSTRWTMAGGEVAAPIPSFLPKFRKNQVITMRVMSKGKVKFPKKVTIPFNHSKGGINEYNRTFTRRGISITHNAEIARRKNDARRGNLNFFARDESSGQLVVYTVIYKLRRVR